VTRYNWAVVGKHTGEVVRIFPFGGDVGTPLLTQFRWEATLAAKKIVEQRPGMKGKVCVVRMRFVDITEKERGA